MDYESKFSIWWHLNFVMGVWILNFLLGTLQDYLGPSPKTIESTWLGWIYLNLLYGEAALECVNRKKLRKRLEVGLNY